MDLSKKPNFRALARTEISIFHPEVMDFPGEVIELAITYKALMLEKSYDKMLEERRK